MAPTTVGRGGAGCSGVLLGMEPPPPVTRLRAKRKADVAGISGAVAGQTGRELLKPRCAQNLASSERFAFRGHLGSGLQRSRKVYP